MLVKFLLPISELSIILFIVIHEDRHLIVTF